MPEVFGKCGFQFLRSWPREDNGVKVQFRFKPGAGRAVVCELMIDSNEQWELNVGGLYQKSGNDSESLSAAINTLMERAVDRQAGVHRWLFTEFMIALHFYVFGFKDGSTVREEGAE